MLLHGPPGCGKTLVARSVAAEFDAEVHEISAASVFGAYTGITDRQHQPSHTMICCRMLLQLKEQFVHILCSQSSLHVSMHLK